MTDADTLAPVVNVTDHTVGPVRERARRGSTVAWVVAVIAAVVATIAVVWAVATILRPVDDPLEATQFTTVVVEQGSVGSSSNLNTVAMWKPTPVGTNGAVGIVTEVTIAAGDEVRQGSVLYSVDLRPVAVAAGTVPAFRSIGQGTQGADVAQLQKMLRSLGFYAGEPDGKAGAGTVAAIRAWQKASGVAQTGTVEFGDVIFVPSLPTRVSLDPDRVRRGASLSGGEEVLRGLPEAPVFTIPVTDAQAGMIPTGTQVQVTAPDGTVWEAVTTDQTVDNETQTVVIGLTGADGGSVCGQACGLVPVTGEALLSSVIVTVPTVEGLVVPSAALTTDASGQVAVIDASGKRIPVTVIASARGMSVVEGVDGGVLVRVPAADGAVG